jgi:DNA-binding NarL/FixJ family response regulator
MDQDPTVLLIDQDSAAIDSIRRTLADQANRFKLRRVADVPTALARIWGGGIDLVLLNLAGGVNPVESAGNADNPLAPFRELQEKAQGVPLVILCDSAAEGLARAAVQQGAAAYLLLEACATDLLQVLRSAAGKTAPTSTAQRTLAPSGKRGKIIAFMGT